MKFAKSLVLVLFIIFIHQTGSNINSYKTENFTKYLIKYYKL